MCRTGLVAILTHPAGRYFLNVLLPARMVYTTRASQSSIPTQFVHKRNVKAKTSVFLFFDGSHSDVFPLGTITIKVTVKHTQFFLFHFILVKLATCFDPFRSSAGLHYEPVNYKAVYILGIPNNVYNTELFIIISLKQHQTCKLCTFLGFQTMFKTLNSL